MHSERCESSSQQLKKFDQFVSNATNIAYTKCNELSDAVSKKCDAFLRGRGVSSELSEKIATRALRIIPIALAFLIFTPTLSLTSIALAAAVSAAVVNSTRVCTVSKTNVLQGAALAIAVQTTLSVGLSLLRLSPIGAFGELLVGGSASAFAFYQSQRLKKPVS